MHTDNHDDHEHTDDASETHVNRVMQALLDRLGLNDDPRLGRLWTDEGPTEAARAQLAQRDPALSSAEGCMILAAWAVWQGSSVLSLAGALEHLDNADLEALFGAILALRRGDAAAEAWLRTAGHAERAKSR